MTESTPTPTQPIPQGLSQFGHFETLRMTF
jgi:hypothetical protein